MVNVLGLGLMIWILLNDNLFNWMIFFEIVVVMGYEFGYYVFGYIWKLIIVFIVIFLIVFYIVYCVVFVLIW